MIVLVLHEWGHACIQFFDNLIAIVKFLDQICLTIIECVRTGSVPQMRVILHLNHRDALVVIVCHFG